MTHHPAPYNQPAPTDPDPLENFRVQGEYLGDQLTPASVRTDPTPEDLQRAAFSYASAALGSGVTVGPLQPIPGKPDVWEASVSNGTQHSTLVAKRVVGGYDLYVEGIQGSTDGQV